MMPFVLMGRTKLPPESAPSDEDVYDDYRQLWINKKSGRPLVSCMQSQARQDIEEHPDQTEADLVPFELRLVNGMNPPIPEVTVLIQILPARKGRVIRDRQLVRDFRGAIEDPAPGVLTDRMVERIARHHDRIMTIDGRTWS